MFIGQFISQRICYCFRRFVSEFNLLKGVTVAFKKPDTMQG
jgi:hypothetical protein